MLLMIPFDRLFQKLHKKVPKFALVGAIVSFLIFCGFSHGGFHHGGILHAPSVIGEGADVGCHGFHVGKFLTQLAHGNGTVGKYADAGILFDGIQLKLQMSMAGAAGQMPSEDMQRFQQLASLLYMNSDVQAYLLCEMQMQKTLADIFKILTEAAGVTFDLPENA